MGESWRQYRVWLTWKIRPAARHVVGGVLGLLVLSSPEVGAETQAERTLSPYFFVRSGEAGTEQLPLKRTSVEVEIAGVIADVRVTQVYANTGPSPIEAVYIFPGSTRAAVHGLRMTIGERVHRAQIAERQAAQAAYTRAKDQGKSASLLEQHRPNVFQMSVANILPGDEIQVELSYTEPLLPTNGVYEFVFPTVVGPRYSNQPARAAPRTEQWVVNPYLRQGQRPSSSFDIQVSLATGLPIQAISSPSHQLSVSYQDTSQASVRLADTEHVSGNRDYILHYQLQGKAIEAGLLLYEGGEDEQENFFLFMVQPPKRVRLEQIPPREHVFILDISGSMRGFPLQTAQELVRALVSSLRPSDWFNIVLFAGGSALLSEQSLPATSANVRHALRWVDQTRGGGGTELLPALRRALALPQAEGTARSFILITDGYVSVETAAFDLIRHHLHQANVFACGIGSSVNRFLIEGIARAGAGEPFILTHPGDAPALAATFQTYIQTPVLTDVRVDYRDFPAYDVEPASLPDVFAQRPLVIFGKWRGSAHGTITITGQQGDATYAHTVEVEDVTPLPTNAALRYLWARSRIASLGDYQTLHPQDEYVQQITNLGLHYNLLTAYTSFVAVDERIRKTAGRRETVRQPLPLPHGVSNQAIPTVPEPETYLMLGLAGLFLLWAAYQNGFQLSGLLGMRRRL